MRIRTWIMAAAAIAFVLIVALTILFLMRTKAPLRQSEPTVSQTSPWAGRWLLQGSTAVSSSELDISDVKGDTFTFTLDAQSGNSPDDTVSNDATIDGAEDGPNQAPTVEVTFSGVHAHFNQDAFLSEDELACDGDFTLSPAGTMITVSTDCGNLDGIYEKQ